MTGGTAPAVMNGANEIAVARFLAGEIGFYDIPRLVGDALAETSIVFNPGLEEILAADAEGRRIAAR